MDELLHAIVNFYPTTGESIACKVLHSLKFQTETPYKGSKDQARTSERNLPDPNQFSSQPLPENFEDEEEVQLDVDSIQNIVEEEVTHSNPILLKKNGNVTSIKVPVYDLYGRAKLNRKGKEVFEFKFEELITPPSSSTTTPSSSKKRKNK